LRAHGKGNGAIEEVSFVGTDWIWYCLSANQHIVAVSGAKILNSSCHNPVEDSPQIVTISIPNLKNQRIQGFPNKCQLDTIARSGFSNQQRDFILLIVSFITDEISR